MHRLSWWGRRGPGCQERWGEGPLLLEVVPLHGADEDALLSHPQAGGGGRRGGEGQLDREEGSCVCMRAGVCTRRERKRAGRKPGERPSGEKAAIVKAGQLHQGPGAGGWGGT